MGIDYSKSEYSFESLKQERTTLLSKGSQNSNVSNFLTSLSTKQVRKYEFDDLLSKIFLTYFPKLEKPSLHSSVKIQNNSFDFSLDSYYNKGKEVLFFPVELKHALNMSTVTITEKSATSSSDLPELTLDKQKVKTNYRGKYYEKLVINKIWQPDKKEKTHNTIFFFDWDDTLMCTSFLAPNGQFSGNDLRMNPKDREKLKNLDSLVAEVLKKTTECGDVYIITNAAPGWVEFSAKKYYPSASQYLGKVEVISARGKYDRIYPGDSRQWKLHAFIDSLKDYNKNLVTNLLCFGDSIIEIESTHNLAARFSNVFIKTVKFKENPLPGELHKQLSLVIERFPQIYSSVKNLDIRVEKKEKQ